jgi:phytoene dehydrogenase-like protein
MANWNQDEAYGGFGGAHGMVKGGYGAITQAMTVGLDVRLGTPVSSVKHTGGDSDKGGVVVTTAVGLYKLSSVNTELKTAWFLPFEPLK